MWGYAPLSITIGLSVRSGAVTDAHGCEGEGARVRLEMGGSATKNSSRNREGFLLLFFSLSLSWRELGAEPETSELAERLTEQLAEQQRLRAY